MSSSSDINTTPSAANDEPLYIGIDVGTGSVRAALLTRRGALLASATQPITTHRDPADHRVFEQSTADIWAAVCKCVRRVVADADADADEAGVGKDTAARVRGLGFDATCSLAVVNAAGRPASVTRGEGLGRVAAEGEEMDLRNVILWADHRAEEEAERINASGAAVLQYVGGKMSLEMELPKILWLKQRTPPPLFAQLHFFDLPDFLTFRATGCRTSSACSLRCKCGYLPPRPSASPSAVHEHASEPTPSEDAHPTAGGWARALFVHLGMDEFVANNFAQLGGSGEGANGAVLTAGTPVGGGLSKEAAAELGLRAGTPVGSGVIDAYAGWIGTISARYADPASSTSTSATTSATSPKQTLSAPPSLAESHTRVAAVTGTSSCFLVQTPGTGVFVPGVWGPFKDAVFPGWWMNEGGQSSTGQLIEFMLTTHPAHPELVARAGREGVSIYRVLEDTLAALRAGAGVDSDTELTKDLHVYPDLHGNRSPIADPRMTGAITGLTLDRSLGALARLFHATLTALALQTRHILATINTARAVSSPPLPPISALHVSGGQARNAALARLLADVCGVRVVLPPQTSEHGVDVNAVAVCRGTAVLGRYASEEVERGASEEEAAGRLWAIMAEMTPAGTVVLPSASAREKRILDAKYAVFLESVDVQRRWRGMVEEACRAGE